MKSSMLSINLQKKKIAYIEDNLLSIRDHENNIVDFEEDLELELDC